MKKEEDKRLIIPKDGFEEDASEGLGKLNREEAAEDLHELKGRMEHRLRKPSRYGCRRQLQLQFCLWHQQFILPCSETEENLILRSLWRRKPSPTQH